MAEQVWTLKSALDWTVAYLTEKGDKRPRMSAEWLLSAATGLSRVELYTHHDQPLSPEERATLREGVKRRATGEPLQYVTGEMPFRHIVVRVVPGVFIPRPETETLVGEGIEFLRDNASSGPIALDLCTGSGAVACSLAHEHGDVRVWATDLSPIAVTTARGNVERLCLADRVTVLEGDVAAPLPADLLGRVDLLLSNPPYIPSADMRELPSEVRGHEPHLALDGGPDGLDYARRIIEEGRRWLRPGGLLAMELDERCVGNALKTMSAWYEGCRAVSDLAGRDRVARGRLR